MLKISNFNNLSNSSNKEDELRIRKLLKTDKLEIKLANDNFSQKLSSKARINELREIKHREKSKLTEAWSDHLLKDGWTWDFFNTYTFRHHKDWKDESLKAPSEWKVTRAWFWYKQKLRDYCGLMYRFRSFATIEPHKNEGFHIHQLLTIINNENQEKQKELNRNNPLWYVNNDWFGRYGGYFPIRIKHNQRAVTDYVTKYTRYVNKDQFKSTDYINWFDDTDYLPDSPEFQRKEYLLYVKNNKIRNGPRTIYKGVLDTIN